MLLNDSFKIAQQVRAGVENRANLSGLLIEQQLYLTSVGTLYAGLLFPNTPTMWIVYLWLEKPVASKDKIPVIILVILYHLLCARHSAKFFLCTMSFDYHHLLSMS